MHVATEFVPFVSMKQTAPRPQLFERLPDAAPNTPRQPITDEQGDPLPPAEALAPAKVGRGPGILRSRVSSRNAKLIRSIRTLRSTRAYFRLSSVTGRVRLTLNAQFFDLQARATSEIAVADLNDSENR